MLKITRTDCNTGYMIVSGSKTLGTFRRYETAQAELRRLRAEFAAVQYGDKR